MDNRTTPATTSPKTAQYTPQPWIVFDKETVLGLLDQEIQKIDEELNCHVKYSAYNLIVLRLEAQKDKLRELFHLLDVSGYQVNAYENFHDEVAELQEAERLYREGKI